VGGRVRQTNLGERLRDHERVWDASPAEASLCEVRYRGCDVILRWFLGRWLCCCGRDDRRVVLFGRWCDDFFKCLPQRTGKWKFGEVDVEQDSKCPQHKKGTNDGEEIHSNEHVQKGKTAKQRLLLKPRRVNRSCCYRIDNERW